MTEQPTEVKFSLPWGRPAAVFALSLALAVALWGLGEWSHRGRLNLETRVAAEQAGRRLSDFMEDRMNLSSFLAENWESAYEADARHFERDARSLLRRFPGFQAINWLDAEGVIRVVVPREPNAPVLHADLPPQPNAPMRDALDRAREEDRLVRTPATLELIGGGRGFATYRTVFSDDGPVLGYVNGVFRVDEVVDTCLDGIGLKDRFQFALREANGELVYPVDAPADYLIGPGSAVQSVMVADQPWQFFLAPASAYLLQQRFAAHHLLLPLGLLAALSIAGLQRRLMGRTRALHNEAGEGEGELVRMGLSAAIDQAEEGVVVTDPEGKVVYVNSAAGGDGAGGALADFLRPRGMAPGHVLDIEKAIAGAVPWRGSCPIDGPQGHPCQLVISLFPIFDPKGGLAGFVQVQRDITREAELQTKLRQAQKLETVGRLTGGIAHDFNNILQSLVGYTSLARRNTANPGEVTACLDEIEKASLRAANMVSQIQNLGSETELDRQPIQLKPVIEEVTALVRGSLPEGIRLTVEFSALQYEVSADPTQIHQVLMNLASNALHALRAGGSLDIRYEAIDLGDSEVQRWPILHPGPHMRVIVKDSGVGMDAKTLDRIFEPCFSTRAVGTGTGLATVHGIVEDHKGVVFAESSPGNGAMFTILLPASTSRENAPTSSQPAVVETSEVAAEKSDTGKLRVLYVDDEAQILDSMRRILERFGFAVSGFTSSRAALEALRNAPTSFDILVTDLTMPDLNGIELAEAILEILPEMPMIFCSGYGDSFGQSMADHANPRRVFLRKPVSARFLSEEIQRLASLAGLST